jgi:SAM-dependent methyltransferase
VSGEERADPFTRTRTVFGGLVSRYGHDLRALDYSGPQAQQKRFEVLADAVPLDGLRVLDVGCGFADFADFLAERAPTASYVGVDITPEVLDQARRAHPDLELIDGNILTTPVPGPVDVAVANGIFYLLGSDGPRLIKEIIARLFELVTTAVVITTLSAWSDRREEGEFHADPLELLDFCRTLTTRLVFRHDYHPGDFAIYLYKAGSA